MRAGGFRGEQLSDIMSDNKIDKLQRKANQILHLKNIQVINYKVDICYC